MFIYFANNDNNNNMCVARIQNVYNVNAKLFPMMVARMTKCRLPVVSYFGRFLRTRIYFIRRALKNVILHDIVYNGHWSFRVLL